MVTISCPEFFAPGNYGNGGSRMKYIEFGPNKDKVSVIGAGCMRIARMNQTQAEAFVKSSLEYGINFFDHADIYGGGESERVFGRLFAEQPSLRDSLFLQSKCAIHDGMYDFSGDYILKSVDGILERLNTDHIDSLLLHRPDALMEPEEVGEGGKDPGLQRNLRFSRRPAAHRLADFLSAPDRDAFGGHKDAARPDAEAGHAAFVARRGGIPGTGGGPSAGPSGPSRLRA